MNRFLVLALLGWITHSGPTGLPARVCLDGHPSVQREYQQSTAVLIGRVVSDRDVPESDGHYEGTSYTVGVRQVFRGQLADSIEIFSENSSGRFPMERSNLYLLFLYRVRDRYMVDNCGNSALLLEASAVLDTLEQLREPTRTRSRNN